MGKSKNFQYYVEGEDEKRLLETLKLDLRCMEPGRIEKFNVIQKRISLSKVRTLKRDTTVIFVYDTDVDEQTDILRENLCFLRKQAGIREVLCVPQVKNLEDELKYACGLNKIHELTGSRTAADFKKDMLKCSNLHTRLSKCGFDLGRLWSRTPDNRFREFGNDAEKIKLYKNSI